MRVQVGPPLGMIEKSVFLSQQPKVPEAPLTNLQIGDFIKRLSDDELLLAWEAVRRVKGMRAKASGVIRLVLKFPTAVPVDWPVLVASLNKKIDELDSSLKSLNHAVLEGMFREELAARGILVSWKDFGGLTKEDVPITLSRNNMPVAKIKARAEFDFTQSFDVDSMRFEEIRGILQKARTVGVFPFLLVAGIIAVLAAGTGVAVGISSFTSEVGKGLSEGAENFVKALGPAAATSLVVVAVAAGALLVGIGVSLLV